MKTLTLLATAILLAACSAAAAPAPSTPSPSVPTPAASPTSLQGRTFLSIGVMKKGAAQRLVPGTRIRLDFGNDGRLGVAAGCNMLGTTYRIEAGTLVTSDGATTEIGCPQPAQAQDEWVFSFVLSRPALALSGDELTLARGDLVAQFLDLEVALPDLPLTGTHWAVTTLLSRDVASSVPAGILATLQFGDDGRVAVSTGCNTGSGTWTVEGGNLSLGPIGLTKKACPGAGTDVEHAVVAILNADRITWTIAASTLSLRSDGAGLDLIGN